MSISASNLQPATAPGLLGDALACVFTPETGERWAAGLLPATRAVTRSRSMLRLLSDERESFVIARKGTGLFFYRTGDFTDQARNVHAPLKHEIHFHDLGVPAFVPRPGRLRPSGLSS